MKAFEYVTAASPESATQLVELNGRYLGGGIDLLGEMKEYISTPARVVNIKELSGLRDIALEEDGSFRIGANATVAELAAHPGIREMFPGLAEAASEVGSPQIRNVATVGGNLAQHSRCWYYRQRDVKCLKRGGNTCYAREGQSKFSSIFSGNPCISPVVSNLSVALSALNGSVFVLIGGKEERISIADLYADAWNNPLAHNSLGPVDLILSVKVPAAGSGIRSTYMQVSEKSDFDWALVSCAAAARVEQGKFVDPRVALGACAPVPFQVEEANAWLNGKAVNADTVKEMAGRVLAKAAPTALNAYKVPIAEALIRRSLLALGTQGA